MKLNPNLRLRKIGTHHMVVKGDTGVTDMTEVYSMNETAAMLWRRAEGIDFTTEMMAGWLCEEYDVEPVTALEDVRSMLSEWLDKGLALQ